MSHNPESSSRRAELQPDGSYNIPIKSGTAQRELLYTQGPITDGDWEPYDPVRHSQKLLPDLREQFASEDNVDVSYEKTEIDPYSHEGLEEISRLLKDSFREMNDWRTNDTSETLSEDDQELYSYLRAYFSRINDLIREQKDLVETDFSEDNDVGERIGEEINLFLKMKALLLSETESELPKESRTGWWNESFRKNNGYGVRGADGTLKQVWGERDGDIGYKTSTRHEEQAKRTGWWDAQYTNEQGVNAVVSQGPFTQRGDLDGSPYITPPSPEIFVSRPGIGRTGQVIWSLRDPEDLPSQVVPLDNFDEEPSVIPLEEEVVTIPTSLAYESARQEWVEAKTIHDKLQGEYKAAVENFYDTFWNRTRAAVGFRPDLPTDIEDLRQEMFSATATYNKASREMIDLKVMSSSPEQQKILERHSRMFAHSLVLRTFNNQLEAQKSALEIKDNAAFRFVKKWGKELRIAGAATVGLATGGLFTGAWMAGRVIAGAAVSGAAVGVVGEYVDKGVDAKRKVYSGQYEFEVDQLVTSIQIKRDSGQEFSPQELSHIYERLESFYSVVDSATQDRIRILLATGLVSGLAFGFATSEIADVFGASTTPDLIKEELDATTNTPTSRIAPEAAIDQDVTPASNPTSTTLSETTPTIPYIAENGDNFWDLMEGQTDAKILPVMEHISEEDKQSFIAKVAERINSDDALRAEIGFGDTADMLREEGAIDVSTLNKIAEAVAKENNFTIDIPDTTVATEDVADLAKPLPEVGVESGVISEGPAVKSESEAVIITKVSPVQINDFGRNYPGSFLKFGQDFEAQWVEKIQGPAPASSGFLDSFFSTKPNSANAYIEFGSYSISQFKEFATLDEATLASKLSDKYIDMKDYLAWRDEITKWEKDGLIINPKDRFSHVAEAAFIKSLVQPPKL